MAKMFPYSGVTLASVFVCVLGAGDQAIQDPSVTPVRIDAVVTDSQGGALRGLRVSDFVLRGPGPPGRLLAAEFRTTPRHSPSPALPISTELDESRAASERGTRVFAFFLDEFHVSPGASAARATQAVASFVDEKVHERDLAAVIRPLDSVSSVRFTRDRALVHGALAGFAGRKNEYGPRTPLEAQYVGIDPATASLRRRRIVSASLRELAMRIGTMKADRAVIVFVSEGFPADTASPDREESDLQNLLRASAQFHFPIYPFNPAAAGEDVASGPEREGAVAMLRSLAAESGGVFISSDKLIAGFARVAHDTEAYYTLTYQPTAQDGAFHPIDIRVGRRDVSVRTRTGLWSTAASHWTELAALSPTIPHVSGRLLRRSPLIDEWVGLRRDASGGAHMTVAWEPRNAEHTVAAHRVAIRARDLEGATLFDGTLAHADTARFDVRHGRVELDLTVLGSGGNVLDTGARDVDVPDLGASKKRGPVLLAAEIVRARTLQEFQVASRSPNATPASTRTFARGDRLLIRVQAFDASGAEVRVTARLLNRAGQPMRDLQATGSAISDGVTQFVLPLLSLAADDYQIDVQGTNENGTVGEHIPVRVN